MESKLSKNQISLPETGLVRLSSILAPNGPLPISKSTWWSGVKAGRFPRPVKLGPRVTAWKVSDIRALFERAEAEADDGLHASEDPAR
jgi:prophage regulatory protein